MYPLLYINALHDLFKGNKGDKYNPESQRLYSDTWKVRAQMGLMCWIYTTVPSVFMAGLGINVLQVSTT
jgi:hypothetical protein